MYSAYVSAWPSSSSSSSSGSSSSFIPGNFYIQVNNFFFLSKNINLTDKVISAWLITCKQINSKTYINRWEAPHFHVIVDPDSCYIFAGHFFFQAIVQFRWRKDRHKFETNIHTATAVCQNWYGPTTTWKHLWKQNQCTAVKTLPIPDLFIIFVETRIISERKSIAIKKNTAWLHPHGLSRWA